MGAVFIGLLLVVLLLPVWFPWLLQPILQKQGAKYSSYQRIGYTRFALTEWEYANPKIKFQAQRIEAFQPSAWLWHHYFSRQKNQPDFLKINDWQLTLLENKNQAQAKTPSSVPVIFEKVERALPHAQNWLPGAQFRRGKINFGKIELPVSAATWKNNTLAAQIFLPRQNQTAQLEVTFSPERAAEISLVLLPLNLETKLSLTKKADTIQLVGNSSWQSNRLDFDAQFSRDNWLPEKATAQSKSFRGPSEKIKLEGYHDLARSLSAQLEHRQFAIDFTARADPLSGKENILPPVEAVIHAAGNTNLIRIETARIFAPWLQTELSTNAAVDFHGQLLSQAVTWKIKGDLTKQNFIPATGNFGGEAFLRPGQKKYPDINFNLRSADFKGFGLRAERMNLQGAFHWPALELTNATAHFSEGGDLIAQA
ncbi:MAG: hypothetical protein ACR2H1_09590, partial [Limisphaerales bacterium]